MRNRDETAIVSQVTALSVPVSIAIPIPDYTIIVTSYVLGVLLFDL